MENPAATTPPGKFDHAFLDSVEIEIAQALARVSELEAGWSEPAPENNRPWHAAFTELNESLANWGSRLEQMTARTSAAEADLNEQENELRSWFQSLGLTSAQLSAATK